MGKLRFDVPVRILANVRFRLEVPPEEFFVAFGMLGCFGDLAICLRCACRVGCAVLPADCCL